MTNRSLLSIIDEYLISLLYLNVMMSVNDDDIYGLMIIIFVCTFFIISNVYVITILCKILLVIIIVLR